MSDFTERGCIIFDDVVDAVDHVTTRPFPTSAKLDRLMRKHTKYYRDGVEVDDPTAPVSVMAGGEREILDEIHRLICGGQP